MMIELSDSIIPFQKWHDIYRQVRLKEIPADRFGYGMQVDASWLGITPDLPLKPHFFFLTSNRRNKEFPIHVDGVPGSKNAASINWALAGCDHTSPTDFYICCEDIVWKDLDNSYFLENTAAAVKTHSTIMYNNHAYLFRSDLLHRGYCQIDDSSTRIIVKWELEYDTWETACKEFYNRNYI